MVEVVNCQSELIRCGHEDGWTNLYLLPITGIDLLGLFHGSGDGTPGSHIRVRLSAKAMLLPVRVETNASCMSLSLRTWAA